MGSVFNYAYDGAGNLLSFDRWNGSAVETIHYIYNGANQIKCVDADNSGACDGSEFLWAYDVYGNLTNDGTTTYTYDAANRLITVVKGGVTTSYTYNGDGNRISQTVGTTTTIYVLDTATPLTMVLSETNVSTGQTTYYWQGLDTLGQSDGANTKYFEYDGLGSVRQLIDPSASVLLAQTFDPYGNGFSKAGTATTDLGFAGEQTDSNGFVFLRARYYSPSMGRFFQTDPSRKEKNPYLYAAASPVTYVDPSGLYRWWRTSSWAHEWIEDRYEFEFGYDFVHSEFPMPGLGPSGGTLVVDSIHFVNPTTISSGTFQFAAPTVGEVYEIEPINEIDTEGHGWGQANFYKILLHALRDRWHGVTSNGIYYDWREVEWVLGTSYPEIPDAIEANNGVGNRYIIFWRQLPGLVVYIDTADKEQVKKVGTDPRFAGVRHSVAALLPEKMKNEFQQLIGVPIPYPAASISVPGGSPTSLIMSGDISYTCTITIKIEPMLQPEMHNPPPNPVFSNDTTGVSIEGGGYLPVPGAGAGGYGHSE